MSRGLATPDSKISWAACFGAFISHFLTAGSEKAFSVWYVEIQTLFGASAASTSSIIGLSSAIRLLLSPLAVLLISIFSIRKVVMCGGILCSIGMLICSCTNNFKILFISYAFVYGFGLTLVFTPALLVCTSYFNKRRATALSLSLSGAGFGAFILPVLVQHLIARIGFHSAMMIYSGINLHYCVSAALFFHLEESEADERKRIHASKKKIRDGYKCQALFTDFCFLLFVSSFIFNMMGSGPVTTLIIDYADNLGIPRKMGVFLISVEGAAQVFSRLGSGPVFDNARIKKYRGYIWSIDLSICSIIVLLICLVYNLTTFVILMAFRGLTLAIYISQQTLITADMSEGNPNLLNNAVGFTQFCKGVGILTGSYFSGFIKDVSGDYRYAFFFLGSMQFLGFIMSIIAIKIRRNQISSSVLDQEILILSENEDETNPKFKSYTPQHVNDVRGDDKVQSDGEKEYN